MNLQILAKKEKDRLISQAVRSIMYSERLSDAKSDYPQYVKLKEMSIHTSQGTDAYFFLLQ